MSGIKETKIEITNVQWNNVQNRLNELDNKNKEYARRLQQERDNANRIATELNTRSQRELEALQRNFNSQLRQKEEAHNKELGEKIEQARREAEELRRRAMEEQDRNFRAQLEAEAKERERQLRQLEADMDARITRAVDTLREELDEKELGRKELLDNWLNVFKDLYDEINSGRHHQEHCQAGRMATFRQAYENALNMRDSAPEGALGSIVAELTELTQFSIDLARYERIWQESYNIINEDILSLEDRISQSRNAGYELDGSEFHVDLNTWSHGEIDAIAQEICDVKQNLLERNHEMSKEELDIVACQIANLDNKFEIARNEAIHRVVECEYRIEMLSNITDELRRSGWVGSEYGCLDNNPEEGVCVTLHSLIGNDEMVITIQQDNRLVVEQHIDGVRVAEIERQNGEVVMETLAGIGICAERLRESTRRPELTTGRPRQENEYYVDGEENK